MGSNVREGLARGRLQCHSAPRRSNIAHHRRSRPAISTIYLILLVCRLMRAISARFGASLPMQMALPRPGGTVAPNHQSYSKFRNHSKFF
jgi:hypothetical protein